MRFRVAVVAASAAVALVLTGVPAATADAPEARKAKTTFAGDGMYQVGKDIRPGTYVSTATGSFGGYWERLSCASGAFDCIIANGNPEGQVFVTIESSDKYFSTSRMGTWRLASSVRPKRPATSFSGDGMYRVGIDIRAGTYVSKSQGTFGGYWERLSCATGGFNCIIANGNPEGQVFVTIEPGDAYFSTSRMGTWKRR